MVGILNHRDRSPKFEVGTDLGTRVERIPTMTNLFETEVFHKLLKRCGLGTSDKLAAKVVATRASIAITATQLTESWEEDKRAMYFMLYDTTIGLDGHL